MTGEELLNAVSSKGISIEYGESLPEVTVSDYWNSQALQYDSVDAFLSGIGLSQGGTVTVNLNLCGDVLLANIGSSSPVYLQPATVFHENGGVDCMENGKIVNVGVTGGPLRVDHGSSWASVYVEYFKYPLTVLTLKEDSSDTTTLLPINESRMAFGSIGGTVDVTVDSIDFFFAVNAEGKLCVCYRGSWTETSGLYSNPDKWTVASYKSPSDGSFSYGVLNVKPDLGASSITFTWESGGGGGEQTTLVFTATAGLSGRHCDPMHGDTNPNHPVARSEVPSYGSGGYGGHGGGGGAGAATVIIRKFASGKADQVQQVARTRRHGYGSGGGAGGKGGDGCIIIFW